MAIAQSEKDAWGFGVPWQAGDTTSHANLEGSLDGTSGGVPILWGAASEGPASAATAGILPGMILCPANGVDTFAIFNRNDGSYNSSQVAVYRDYVQSYGTTEPAIDLTSTSFLMWSWRIAGGPDPLP